MSLMVNCMINIHLSSHHQFLFHNLELLSKRSWIIIIIIFILKRSSFRKGDGEGGGGIIWIYNYCCCMIPMTLWCLLNMISSCKLIVHPSNQRFPKLNDFSNWFTLINPKKHLRPSSTTTFSLLFIFAKKKINFRNI